MLTHGPRRQADAYLVGAGFVQLLSPQRSGE